MAIWHEQHYVLLKEM